MNLLLNTNPVSSEIPEEITQVLYDDGLALTCAFCSNGSLLAIGGHDGRISLWDCETYHLVKILCGHVRPILSLSWSSSCNTLVSCANDYSLVIWNVYTGAIDLNITLETIAYRVQFHPFNNHLLLVSFLYGPPQIFRFTEDNSNERNPTYCLQVSEHEYLCSPQNGITTLASFNNKGDHIYSHDSARKLSIYHLDSNQKPLLTHEIFFDYVIKHITFNSDDSLLLVTCVEPVICCLKASDLTILREYQDIINRLNWKKCLFSRNADFIIAVSTTKSQHRLFVYTREDGILFKIFEGPKSAVLDFCIHPTLPVLCSVSTDGSVYVWDVPISGGKWNTYAPDFEDIEENVEYFEQEDEFDIIQDPDEEPIPDKAKGEMETIENKAEILDIGIHFLPDTNIFPMN